MSERPRLAHWPDDRVISVVEESIQKIEAARRLMWHDGHSDSDNFNTPDRYAEFSASDDELVDAINTLKAFLGPTAEEAEADAKDRRSAAEWRQQYETVAAELALQQIEKFNHEHQPLTKVKHGN